MGRKPIEKKRNTDPRKREALAELLLPALNGDGISQMTMDDIAKRLGRSKATIYKYFRSQEELFALALGQKLKAIQGFVPILGDQSMDYVERYRRALEHLSLSLTDLSNPFLADIRKDFPALSRQIDDFVRMVRLVLLQFYQEGIEDNIIKGFDPMLLVVSDEAVINAYLNPEFLEKKNITLRQAFEEYFRMKFFGLLDEGHRGSSN